MTEERSQPAQTAVPAGSGPPRWSLAELLAARWPAPVITWVTPSVRARVRAELPGERFAIHEDGGLPERAGALLVIGGGKLIDRAKLLRQRERPRLQLLACASLWGSGAEVSPIAVADEGERKAVAMGPEIAPDVRVVWPELADSLSPAALRRACGDVWAHAIEAMLSPLAGEALVREAGALVTRLLALPVPPAARDFEAWFDVSAEACLLQARCSVGLVHGIAHVLEGPLARAHPELEAASGHAGLCATFLWPVLQLLQTLSDTCAQRCAQAGVSLERVLAAAHALHDRQLYQRAWPELQARWKSVLRDPCTRTSCALIRPAHLDFFRELAAP